MIYGQVQAHACKDWVHKNMVLMCDAGRPRQEQEGPGIAACTGAMSPGE